MAKKRAIRGDAVLPIRNLQGVNQIDAILRTAANGTRKDVHEAVENVLEGWPGRKRFEIWERLRWLRNCHRNHRWRHSVWSGEDVELLRAHYAGGRAGARRAVKELLARHPDWRSETIWRKAAKLGLSDRCGTRRPWTKDEDAKLLWDGGMKAVRVIARKLNRSEASIRQRLSRTGASAKVRVPKHFTLHRISEMLGVSDSIVRVWYEKGLLASPNAHVKRNGQSSPRVLICREALIAFCVTHPEKVNAKRCDPDVLDWLEEKKVQPGHWNGSRQHLTERKDCPRCGRTVVGNAFSWHVMHCTGSPSPQKPRHNRNGHMARASSESNV